MRLAVAFVFVLTSHKLLGSLSTSLTFLDEAFNCHSLVQLSRGLLNKLYTEIRDVISGPGASYLAFLSICNNSTGLLREMLSFN